MVNFILIHEKTLNSNQVFNTKINFLCVREESNGLVHIKTHYA